MHYCLHQLYCHDCLLTLEIATCTPCAYHIISMNDCSIRITCMFNLIILVYHLVSYHSAYSFMLKILYGIARPLFLLCIWVNKKESSCMVNGLYHLCSNWKSLLFILFINDPSGCVNFTCHMVACCIGEYIVTLHDTDILQHKIFNTWSSMAHEI